ncbi:MAG: alpha-glucosidase, partial [Promethearchaeota archaeon]
FNKYGYFPYTTDSHYGEYIHWAWEKANIEGVNDFKNAYKRYIINTSKRIKRMIMKGKSSHLVKPDGERAIPIIEGILTDANYMEPSVNLPNDDVIINLPRDLVIECPAIVNKKGLTAIKLGEYPKGLAALLRNQASVQDLVVEAILTKSKDIALQALLADPVVESATQAEEMLEEMLRFQKKYIILE